MAPQLTHADLQRLSDADLVAFARTHLSDGEPGLGVAKHAVALVFERHRQLVRGLAAVKCPFDAVDDVEAAVYERFVKVCYQKPDPMTNPAGMLVQMTRFEIANFHDRHRTDHTTLDHAPEPSADDPAYDEVTEATWEQLLAPLSEKHREVAWLRLADGLTSAEIAERLGTTPGNVDVMFFRATKTLRGVAET